MTEGPLSAYRAMVARGDIADDQAQVAAVVHLDELHKALVGWHPDRRRAKFSVFGFGRKPISPRGLYIWGDVGRGKSMLMDLFFDGAPVAAKTRVHFHAFMLRTHERIFEWRQKEKAGEVKGSDPIPPVAAQIAAESRLLCFDEFQVTDIADASILGRLFTHLFDLGVVVVATSNRAPDDLYKGGLNRQRFLPFIELVKTRMDVIALDSPTDYRMDRLKGLPVYYVPLGADATASLDQAFLHLTGRAHGSPRTLALNGRTVEVPDAFDGVARFTFNDLCAKPLGAADYIKIAETFETVIIDDVPGLSPERRNEARRFVTLIDSLYEAKTRLIMSAAVEPATLYPAGDGAFEFHRTVSRLMEMQSADYLAAR